MPRIAGRTERGPTPARTSIRSGPAAGSGQDYASEVQSCSYSWPRRESAAQLYSRGPSMRHVARMSAPKIKSEHQIPPGSAHGDTRYRFFSRNTESAPRLRLVAQDYKGGERDRYLDQDRADRQEPNFVTRLFIHVTPNAQRRESIRADWQKPSKPAGSRLVVFVRETVPGAAARRFRDICSNYECSQSLRNLSCCRRSQARYTDGCWRIYRPPSGGRSHGRGVARSPGFSEMLLTLIISTLAVVCDHLLMRDVR